MNRIPLSDEDVGYDEDSDVDPFADDVLDDLDFGDTSLDREYELDIFDDETFGVEVDDED